MIFFDIIKIFANFNSNLYEYFYYRFKESITNRQTREPRLPFQLHTFRQTQKTINNSITF